MTAGVILAGGRSSRMGRDKAWLMVEGEPLLARTVRILGEVADHVIVAAAADQVLPTLPDGVVVFRDATSFEGPLVGLANVGHSIPSTTNRIFVVACDLPDLSAAFLKWMQDQMDEGSTAVVVEHEGQRNPLCAFYRSTILGHVNSLVENGQRRFQELLNVINPRFVTLDDIPLSLRSPRPWVGVNTPEEWVARGQR